MGFAEPAQTNRLPLSRLGCACAVRQEGFSGWWRRVQESETRSKHTKSPSKTRNRTKTRLHRVTSALPELIWGLNRACFPSGREERDKRAERSQSPSCTKAQNKTQTLTFRSSSEGRPAASHTHTHAETLGNTQHTQTHS